MENANTKAFSLLEMSITLTIIALLIAAVMTGQSLLLQQQLNQVITDISSITTATKQFKTTYNVLPGDMYNAREILGTTTDNGNGNGHLDTSSSVNTTCTTTPNEELLFWQHLALAGLISGSYDCLTSGKGGVYDSPLKSGFYNAHKSSTGNLIIELNKGAGVGILTTKQAFNYDANYDNNTYNTGALTALDGGGTCITGGNYDLSNTTGTPCRMYFDTGL